LATRAPGSNTSERNEPEALFTAWQAWWGK
jgi:hypothetical protein